MKILPPTVFLIGLLALTTATARTQKISDYGAKGDGITENAASIPKAIDAATAEGGGVVLVPAGEFLTTTIFLKDDVTLRLVDGVNFEKVHLWAEKEDPRPDLYPEDAENFERGGYKPQTQP